MFLFSTLARDTLPWFTYHTFFSSLPDPKDLERVFSAFSLPPPTFSPGELFLSCLASSVPRPLALNPGQRLILLLSGEAQYDRLEGIFEDS